MRKGGRIAATMLAAVAACGSDAAEKKHSEKRSPCHGRVQCSTL